MVERQTTNGRCRPLKDAVPALSNSKDFVLFGLRWLSRCRLRRVSPLPLSEVQIGLTTSE